MKRLSEYRIMWLFVFFDLPTESKKDRQVYADFRKRLQGDGFTMMQFSVYIRHCASSESADVHTQRIRNILPESGQVSILRVTDKQFGNMQNFIGQKKQKRKTDESKMPMQLTLF
ncbi:MAG: CRISPR-associated endonuclease Cas2 [Paludibacteraceae bacterium]|nr:CRISPR-associated endonuclease Cas2 [Paludibacteraceae bacterium]